MGYFESSIKYISEINTSNIGKVMPDIVEEYGEGKNVDVFMSASHSLF